MVAVMVLVVVVMVVFMIQNLNLVISTCRKRTDSRCYALNFKHLYVLLQKFDSIG